MDWWDRINAPTNRSRLSIAVAQGHKAKQPGERTTTTTEDSEHLQLVLYDQDTTI